MEFPYGKAALSILLLGVVTSAILLSLGLAEKVEAKPDLIFMTFTKEHASIYKEVLPEFERLHGCKVQLQVVDQRAVQDRLQAEMQAGAPMPDMVELMDGTMGLFTRGPLEDVGFRDITDKVKAKAPDGGPSLYDRLVNSRFSKWTSRDRIFALVHDVHPTFLCYRRDLVEQLGIDVNKLTTWDEFARVGREITKDLDGDGNPDRYMIDLQPDGGDMLRLIMIQHGGALLDKQGQPAFDSDLAVDAVMWYVKATTNYVKNGKVISQRFSFPAGWGQ